MAQIRTTQDPADYNLFDPALKPNPYPFYQRLREEGRVLQNPLLGFWMVTGYEEVLSVLRDPENCSSALFGAEVASSFLPAPTMLFSDPPDHERLRDVVAKAFSPRTVRSMEHRTREITEELLAPLDRAEVFDVVEGLAYPLPVIVIAEMLGVPPEDRDDFKRWSDAVVGFSSFGEEEQGKAEVEVQELSAYFAETIERRRREPGDDLVSQLVAANTDGAMSDEELLAACMLLLVAGNETTTNLISNSVLALGRYPDQRELLIGDPSLLQNAVEEVLRFDGPVQATPRSVLHPIECGGVEIPEGSMVLAMVAAADRDPAVFPDPDVFNIERPNAGRHVAFGYGIHHCIGSPLARLEGRIATEVLLRKAPNYRLLDDETPLEYGPNYFLRGLLQLRIAP